MTFTIPTADELADRLGGLERLLTARKWERAAVVWAFTVTEQGKRTDLGEFSPKFPCSIDAFAALGFAGLTSRDSVRKYREAWQRAIDAGLATSVAPGEAEVEMPEMDWPGTTEIADNPMRARRTDAPERKAEVARNILADPEVAEAFTRQTGAPAPSTAPEPVRVPIEPSARAREIGAAASRGAEAERAERAERDNSPAGSYARFVTELGIASSRLKLAVHLYQTHAEDWQPAQRDDAAELMDLHRAGAVLDVDWDAALADMTDQG